MSLPPVVLAPCSSLNKTAEAVSHFSRKKRIKNRINPKVITHSDCSENSSFKFWLERGWPRLVCPLVLLSDDHLQCDVRQLEASGKPWWMWSLSSMSVLAR